MNAHLFVACQVENTLQLLAKLQQLGVKRFLKHFLIALDYIYVVLPSF